MKGQSEKKTTQAFGENNNLLRFMQNNQIPQVSKPADYQSQWGGQMDSVMGQIQNRPKFQYDVNSDALYQQVAQNYIQQGRNAMMDTMGQAAALTGGYGNSYAQMAGQQAYQGYLQGLTDLVPQYRQMAMDQYQMEGDELLNRYNMMLQREEMDYSRYQDDLNRYFADRDYARSTFESDRAYQQRLKEFQNDEAWAQKEWDYKTGQDEDAKKKEAAQLMAGVDDYSLLAAYYGLTEDQVKKLVGMGRLAPVDTKIPGTKEHGLKALTILRLKRPSPEDWKVVRGIVPRTICRCL